MKLQLLSNILRMIIFLIINLNYLTAENTSINTSQSPSLIAQNQLTDNQQDNKFINMLQKIQNNYDDDLWSIHPAIELLGNNHNNSELSFAGSIDVIRKTNNNLFVGFGLVSLPNLKLSINNILSDYKYSHNKDTFLYPVAFYSVIKSNSLIDNNNHFRLYLKYGGFIFQKNAHLTYNIAAKPQGYMSFGIEYAYKGTTIALEQSYIDILTTNITVDGNNNIQSHLMHYKQGYLGIKIGQQLHPLDFKDIITDTFF